MNKPLRDILILIVSACLSAILLYLKYSDRVNFADNALGEETVRYVAKFKGQPIHHVELSEQDHQLALANRHPGKPVLFMLGNSQTHSINQMKEGEVNFVEMIAARDTAEDLLVHSLPNASLQEQWLLWNWWTDSFNVKELVLPVFMDDLREDGIRSYFIAALVKKRYLLKEQDELSISINKELQAIYDAESTANTKTVKKSTPQERTEEHLEAYLSAHSAIWRNRENARGDFFLGLYNLRNTVFGINASTKRKMIPLRYDKNMAALELILSHCRDKGIKVYLYIPPIRHDLDLPYDAGEYAAFKASLQALATRYGAPLRDLDSIVPGEYWGTKNEGHGHEIDYMHFQYKGHLILADSLTHFIGIK